MTLREQLEASIRLVDAEQRIPRLPRITEPTRLPNKRLWHLHGLVRARIATPEQIDELEAMCAALEAGEVANDE